MKKTRQTVFLLLFVSGLTSLRTVGAQPPATAPKVPTDAAALDIVVDRKTKEKLRGQIRFATQDSINMKPEKEPARLFKTDDYEIEFWNGVTNAAEIIETGKADLDRIDEFVARIRYGESNDTEATDAIRTVKQSATRLLSRIRVINNLKILPAIRTLNPDDIEVLSSLNKRKKAIADLDVRIRNATVYGRQVKRLSGKLRLLELPLRGRRFRDASGECRRLSGPLDNKELRTPVEEEFRKALASLKATCEKLEKTGEFVDEYPATDRLSDVLEDLNVVLPELASPQRIRILGPGVLTQVNAIHKEHLALHRDLSRMAGLLAPVQTARQSWNILQDDVRKGAVESLADLNARLSRLDSELKQLRDGLEPKSRQKVEAAVVGELAAVQRDVQLNQELLRFRVELPLVSAQVRDSRGITEEDEARKLAAVLDTRHKDFSRYLKLPALQGEERRKLEFTLASLRSASARLRGDAMQFIVDNAATALSTIRKNQAGLLSNLDGDQNPLKDFQSLKTSLTTAEKEFADRCSNEKQLSDEAQALLKEFSSTGRGLDQGVQILAVRADFLEPFSRDVTGEEIDEAADRLSQSMEVVAGLSGLPDELAGLHQTTELLLRRRSSELQNLRIQIDADRAAAVIEESLAMAGKTLSEKQTVATAVNLFESELAVNSFRERVNSDTLLAKDQDRQKQVTRFTELVQQLNSGLTEQRRLDRIQDGWLEVPDEMGTLVPATNQNRWLIVEMLIAQGRIAEARKAADDFAESQTDPAWLQKVRETQGWLDLQEARIEEAAGRTPVARSILARLSSSENSLLLRASSSAIQCLDQRMRQKTDVAGQTTRALAAGGFFLGVVLLGGLVVRRDFPRYRLKRARAQLRSLRRIEKRAKSSASRQCRERTALLLASLPDGNVETQKILADLKSGPLKIPVYAAAMLQESGMEIPVQPETDPGDVVASIIASETDSTEPEIAEVVQWLGSDRSRKRNVKKLRAQAIEWLRKVLQPHRHDHPEQLAWKLKFLARCRDAGSRKDHWPMVYEVRIRVLLREWKEALTVARAIPLKGCHQAVCREILSVVTRCYIELEQWDEAEKWIRGAMKSQRKLASKDLQYWLSVAIARQASQSGSRLSSESLQTLINAIPES